MKADLHPKYDKTVVTCGCGNTFETKSTTGAINVEICSACHPFYTGKQKLVDTAGRVDKFRMRMEAAANLKAGTKPKKARVEKAEEGFENPSTVAQDDVVTSETPAEVELDEEITEIAEELTEETVENSEPVESVDITPAEDDTTETK